MPTTYQTIPTKQGFAFGFGREWLNLGKRYMYSLVVAENTS